MIDSLQCVDAFAPSPTPVPRRSRTRPRALLATALTGVLAGSALLSTPATAAPPAGTPTAGAFAVLDPQNWENPDAMTWSDYRRPPGTTWNDPARTGSVRNFDIALVTLDYADQPFVVTQPAGSTIFGNPQPAVSGMDRADVPAYYRDLLNTPNELNRGHTLHEYWMEDSAGRFGVDLTAFGAYRMPHPSFEYGITNDMNPGMCPAGSTCNRNLRTDALGAWRADVGEEVADAYELVFILSAGQDESSTWQEFGEMRFATREDVSEPFGPPVEGQPNHARTRYVDWTSWASAATIWPNAGGGSSTQAESSGMGVYAHELSHLLSIGDNYNNPYGTPLRRAYTGPWSMMSRGSFNGPGGPHTRWQIPAVQGGSMGSLHTLRDKLKIGLVDEQHVLRLSREALAGSGVVVARITARAVAPAAGGLMGLNIAMDADDSPACVVAEDVLCDGGGYDNYTVEVVDRMGADSFTPDAGVMLSKTKNQDRQPFQWTIDANPQDIGLTDFQRPDGTAAKITMGDYRQLADALFHAGTRSGSEYEYVDEANRLHFYILDVRRSRAGELSYTVAVRSLDGAGAGTRGVALGPGLPTGGRPTGTGATCSFPLTNTGRYAAGADQHPEDATAYLSADVYRLSARVQGRGWRVELPNALATAANGRTTTAQVAVGATAGAAPAGLVTLTATSESDPRKTVSRQCPVPRDPRPAAPASPSPQHPGGDGHHPEQRRPDRGQQHRHAARARRHRTRRRERPDPRDGAERRPGHEAPQRHPHAARHDRHHGVDHGDEADRGERGAAPGPQVRLRAVEARGPDPAAQPRVAQPGTQGAAGGVPEDLTAQRARRPEHDHQGEAARAGRQRRGQHDDRLPGHRQSEQESHLHSGGGDGDQQHSQEVEAGEPLHQRGCGVHQVGEHGFSLLAAIDENHRERPG